MADTVSGWSARLDGPGPPVEVGVRLEGGGVEPAAAFGDDGAEFVQRSEVPVDDRLVHRRPEVLGGLELARIGRQEDQADPAGDGQVLGSMPARIVGREDDAALAAGAGLAREEGERFGEEGLRETAAATPERLAAGRLHARRWRGAATGSGGGRGRSVGGRSVAGRWAPGPGAGSASGPGG